MPSHVQRATLAFTSSALFSLLLGKRKTTSHCPFNYYTSCLFSSQSFASRHQTAQAASIHMPIPSNQAMLLALAYTCKSAYDEKLFNLSQMLIYINTYPLMREERMLM